MPMKYTPACLAIKAEAQRLGWPTHWKTDLKLDLHVLRLKSAPDVFGWAIRASGTQLYRPASILSACWLDAAIKVREPGSQNYYWWSGDQLAPMCAEDVMRRLLDTIDRAMVVAELNAARRTAADAKFALGSSQALGYSELLRRHRESQEVLTRADEHLSEYDRLVGRYGMEEPTRCRS